MIRALYFSTMTDTISARIIAACLFTIGIIHLIPLGGFFGAARLETMYGIAIDNDNLEILLRHRAILFGLLGAVFCLSAFRPVYQPLAFALATGTLLPFFFLLTRVDNYNEAIARVALADVLALACLVTAVTCFFINSHHQLPQNG